MNGNIFNYSLALEQYMLGENCGLFGLDCSPYYAYAIPPMPPGIVLYLPTGEFEPIFAQSYINAYNTAFNQETSSFSGNYQVALKNYQYFSPNDVDNNFINGTFGYAEEYSNIGDGEKFRVKYLEDSINNYIGIPYLFISTGSGGGSGFMYLNWIIVVYGVPYVVNAS